MVSLYITRQDLALATCLFLLLGSSKTSHALTNDSMVGRRTIIGSLITSSSATIIPIASQPQSCEAAMPPTVVSGGALQGVGGMTTRVEGIGGGFDITTSKTTSGEDAIYPASMVGPWKCQRVVTSVEGDAGQAEVAWRALGGTGDLRKIESFKTNFILPVEDGSTAIKNQYTFEGQTYSGVVLDRGQEMLSRITASPGTSGKASWFLENPDFLHYERDDGKDIEVAVVQRKVEIPSEKGFGFTELYRVTSYAGGIFTENKVQRAIRVARRYRRALDNNGNRIVEGLEIMKTYRVLDGIAGVEMPTSTTKSQIQLTRVETL